MLKLCYFHLPFFFIATKSEKMVTFAPPNKAVTALSPAALALREESPGSSESPYFLTGRDVSPKRYATASATENIPPPLGGKGENAR